MSKDNMKNWMNYIANPMIPNVKKFVWDLIGAERYTPHDETLETLARTIHNEKDYEKFGKFIAEIYEAGYMRAANEYERELTKIGIKTKLTRVENKKPENPIF